MERRSKHLDAEERGVIFAEQRRGSSLRQIGRLMGRHHGTIGRALTRGAVACGYDPQVARQARDVAQRRFGRRRKLVPEALFCTWVRDRLICWRWSPEQIAARQRRMPPDDPSRRIRHETIHAAIHAPPRGGLKALMIEALRQAKPVRGVRRTTRIGSAMIPETLRTIHPPEEIKARLVPGHWEGDPLLGECSHHLPVSGSRAPSTGRRWARWWSARPASSFSARCAAAPPPLRSKGSRDR